MSSFLRVGLKTKFALLVLVPLGALLAFQINTTLDRRADVADVADIEVLAQLSDSVGDLLHQTQRERGVSSVYVSSSGAAFEDRLLEQHAATDEAIVALDEFLVANESELPSSARGSLDPALDALAELEHHRGEALRLDADSREFVGYYTEMNELFLAVVWRPRPAAELTRSSAAYLTFVQAKEAMGLERAQLAIVFLEDEFADGQLAEVVSLIAVRESLLELYAELASIEMLELLDTVQQGSVPGVVEALEELALTNGDSGFGVDAVEWYDTITARIDLLKVVEDAQSDELMAVAATVSSAARVALRTAMLVATVVILIVALLAAAIVRQIVRETNVISARARDIAAGDLAIQDLEIAGKDTIAELGRSFNQMSTTLRHVGEQMTAVADADLDSPAFAAEIPGELGVVVDSLRSATRGRVELEARERESARRTEELLRAVATQARVDSLTGLASRAALEEAIDERLALSSSSGALLVMGLDLFKDINDTFGHQFGDRVLQNVATRLCSLIRPDDVVARVGGDEFAVVLGGVASDSDIGERSAAFSKEVERIVDFDGVSVGMGVSIGVACWPYDGSTRVELLRRAEIAMYEAKRTKQESVRYTTAIDHTSSQRFQLMSEIRDAIASDQMVLSFQPQVNAADQELVAAEALVRWMHPVQGLIPPREFIPLAERTGASSEMTRFVLEEALGYLAQLTEMGLGLRIGVNLTGRDILDPSLPSLISELLGETGVPGSALTLEVSEGSVIIDVDTAIQNLSALGRLGCWRSLDEFGTGFSCLSFLKQLPIDEVKLGGSFVTNSATNADDEAIVRATIGLGHDLGLEIVAEGVEDSQTLDLLRSLGCDRIQGYFIGRPVSSDAFAALALRMTGGVGNVRPLRPNRTA